MGSLDIEGGGLEERVPLSGISIVSLVRMYFIGKDLL